MYIIINSSKTISLEIHKYSSIFHLKSDIIDKLNNFKLSNFKKIVNTKLNIDNFYLEYNGKILNDNDKSLDYYNIKNNAILNLHNKKKGGGLHILMLIFCGFFVFILIPILLFSGLIPFLLHIVECMMLQLFKSIEHIIIKLPRFHKYKHIFTFFIKICMMIFKFGFLYFGLYTIFTLTYFSWTTLLKGGKNLFVKTDKYCKEIDTLNSLSNVSTMVYLVVYTLFRLPNILVSSFGPVMSFFNKMKFTSLMALVNVPYQNLLTSTYENKWDIFYTIPGVGEVLSAIFEALDLIFDMLIEYSNEITSLGCRVKSLGNFKEIKNKLFKKFDKKDSEITQKNINSAEKDLIKKKRLNTKVCCDENLFHVLKNDIGTLIKGIQISGQEQILKEYGITIKLLQFLEKSFDTKYINESMKKFKDAFFIFKFRDGNFEGIIGYFLRIIFCNIMNISKYTSGVLFKIGTPVDMADTVKCGLMSGQVSLIVYYFSLVFITMTLLDWSKVVTIVVSIIILLLLYLLKSQMPFSPVPLII